MKCIGIALIFFLISSLACVVVPAVNTAAAMGTIYIRADGSIDPVSAPIQRNGDVYTLIDNFTSGRDGIVVQRDNMTLDGAGHTLRSQYVTGRGVDLSLRTNVTIKRFNILNYTVGLRLSNSTNNAAIGNNITNVLSGISIGDSSNQNNLTGNTISQAWSEGFGIYRSSKNIVRNNTLFNNATFYVYGRSITEFTNYVDASNTVEGKPIYYWIGNINDTVPFDAGCVILVNCTNISVQNITFVNSDPGILLAFTKRSIIAGNVLVSNMRSIDIRYSSNNTVVDNNIAMSGVNGIFLEYSSNNTLARNSITGCQYGSGIDFYTTSSYNLVTENTIADNKYGITLTGGSSNNIILHNNFINNTIQVYSYSSTNEWDDGYPLGGNYWSNYTGGDLYSGIHQNETGSDGMGDAPYIIGSDSADHYPLMTPWSQLQGDMNYDRVVNILDIVAISSIYHCQEGEPNWNPEADLAPPYGIINMLDLVTCAYHYGEKYP